MPGRALHSANTRGETGRPATTASGREVCGGAAAAGLPAKARSGFGKPMRTKAIARNGRRGSGEPRRPFRTATAGVAVHDRGFDATRHRCGNPVNRARTSTPRSSRQRTALVGCAVPNLQITLSLVHYRPPRRMLDAKCQLVRARRGALAIAGRASGPGCVATPTCADDRGASGS